MRFSRRLAKTPDSLEWPIKNAVILRLRIPKPWGSHQPNPSLRDLFFWGRGNLLRLIFYFFIFHVFSHKNLKKCRHPEPSLFEGVRISSFFFILNFSKPQPFSKIQESRPDPRFFAPFITPSPPLPLSPSALFANTPPRSFQFSSSISSRLGPDRF